MEGRKGRESGEGRKEKWQIKQGRGRHVASAAMLVAVNRRTSTVSLDFHSENFKFSVTKTSSCLITSSHPLNIKFKLLLRTQRHGKGVIRS